MFVQDPLRVTLPKLEMTRDNLKLLIHSAKSNLALLVTLRGTNDGNGQCLPDLSTKLSKSPGPRRPTQFWGSLDSQPQY